MTRSTDPLPVAIDYSQMADLYDAFVRFDSDIPLFVQEAGGVDGPVLELTSGTGRVSLPLIEAGVTLTCVDYSEDMLAILRRKLAARGLSAEVLREDVRDLNLPPKFPLAIMPFHSFAEFLTSDDRRRALRAVLRCLVPGGRFVCTLHNPALRLRSIENGPTTLGRFLDPVGGGEIEFSAELVHEPATGIVRGVQVFEWLTADQGPYRERRIPVRFVLLEPERFETLARDAGFEVDDVLGDYDRSPFDPETSSFAIWFLRRPPVDPGGASSATG